MAVIQTTPTTSSVSAFDRPDAVIVVGPKPLPVEVTNPGGGGGGGGPPSPSKSGPNAFLEGLKDAGSLILTRFAAVVGPLAILGSVLSAANSGLALLGSAVKVLASTLAPILLPVTFALSVALTELSAQLQPLIFDALPTFVDYMLDDVLPAMEDFVDWLVKVAKLVLNPSDATTGDVVDVASGAVKYGAGPANIGGVASYAFEGALSSVTKLYDRLSGNPEGTTVFGEEAKKKEAEAKGGEGDKGSRAGEAAVRDRNRLIAAEETLQEFKLSLLPKAQFSGIADVGKQIQLGGLNASPYERKMLENFQKAIKLLEDNIAKKRGRTNAAYETERRTTGAGDYSDDEGYGGGGDYGGGL